MTTPPNRVIRPNAIFNTDVLLPGSKSYTNRALITAALADGKSTLSDSSASDDSRVMIFALKEFTVPIDGDPKHLTIGGMNGKIQAPAKVLDISNTGTAMRFLTSFAAIAPGTTRITGDQQMQRRPIRALLESLQMAGIKTVSANGFPPVTVHGGTFHGGTIELDATKSSQFVSSLLLAAPYAKKRLVVRLKGIPSSRPYIDLTLHVMRYFGAEIEVQDYKTFAVDNTARYLGQSFRIEPDASSAAYFFAAAAITGGRVRITNISRDSLQGDMHFLDILDEMGCEVISRDDGIEVHGKVLRGIEVDMNQLPDCVPALAVTAAFARGETSLMNISHLRYKESDRLHTLATELTRIGAKVELERDSMIITPQRLHGAVIETYNDHRIAMSFAIAGLRIPGIEITNPGCVSKSFPTFWQEFRKLEPEE
jgi:3-phosphoshikimate 1-carboxyvinyltransferase